MEGPAVADTRKAIAWELREEFVTPIESSKAFSNWNGHPHPQRERRRHPPHRRNEFSTITVCSKPDGSRGCLTEAAAREQIEDAFWQNYDRQQPAAFEYELAWPCRRLDFLVRSVLRPGLSNRLHFIEREFRDAVEVSVISTPRLRSSSA